MAKRKTETDESVDVKAPSERFPSKMDTTSTMKAADTSTPASSYSPKTVKAKGSQLKQEVAAEAITKKEQATSSGLSTAEAQGAQNGDYSGNTNVIMGNVGGTPTLDDSAQGRTRVDKRLSDANRNINYLTSEQVLVDYDTLPPLSKSDDAIGYNGNPANVYARIQKRTGLTSAEQLYDRSVDEIRHDECLFATGQVVQNGDIPSGAYPTETWDYGDYTTTYTANSGSTYTANHRGWHQMSTSASTTGQNYSKPMTRGNYLMDYIWVDLYHFQDGSVRVGQFTPHVVDLSTNSESAESVNVSSANHYIDLNTCELARQRIDQDCGSPNSEHYNPLGRSSTQPTRYLTYLHDLEAVTGAEVYTAFKFANKARGYYLNRTAKDGNNTTDPASDALYGSLLTQCDSVADVTSVVGTAGPTQWFDDSNMGIGSAALMIAINDATAKYTTKGDIVTQAKGLRMPIQTASNYLGSFYVKKDFVSALNNLDCFSTIDRGYDPTAPVCITDNVGIIYPYNPQYALEYTRDNTTYEKEYSSQVPTYRYSAGSGDNVYYVKCADPLLNGIAWYLEQHAGRIFHELVSGNNHMPESVVAYEHRLDVVRIRIPVVHSTTHFSLWDLLVCAATPYIAYERTNTMKDILDYCNYYSYPFSDMINVKDANPLHAVNYGDIDPYKPLSVGQMRPSTALRWTMPEMLYPLEWASGSSSSFPTTRLNLAPWYMNEREWQPKTVALANDDDYEYQNTPYLEQHLDYRNFSYPVIRSGVRLAYLDDTHGMSPRDMWLSYDPLTRLKYNMSSDDERIYGYVYKYSQDSDGLVANYGAYAASSADVDDIATTVQEWMSLPRATGWAIPVPYGILTPGHITWTVSDNVWTASTGTPAFLWGGSASNWQENVVTPWDTRWSVPVDLVGPSFTARMWRASRQSGPTNSLTITVLGAGGINVGRAQNFQQTWYERSSSPGELSFATETPPDFDVLLSLNDNADFSVTNVTRFNPYITAAYYTNTNGGAANTATPLSGVGLHSFHRIYWALVQKLPFILNPFDLSGNLKIITSASTNRGYHDPFDYAYTFGLAGFVAADWNEYAYNRSMDRMNLGFAYTTDLFNSDSPLLKS